MRSLAGLALSGCGVRKDNRNVRLEFTRIPQADAGGRDKHDIIEGRAAGAHPEEQIVLYARNGEWWLQPLVSRPFTKIQADSKWTAATHLGTEYAALLVKPGFQPPTTLGALPNPDGLIAAVGSVKGAASPPSPSIHLSGYEWRVRNAPSSRGGRVNKYDPRNAWIDASGAMHLRIAKLDGEWACAEVSLTRSLGYGTYSFTVRDTASLDPAVVFAMFTWDYAQADQNFGETDIEISQWGDSAAQNARYTIQPHYLPANVFQFAAPAGALTHSFRWEPARMTFRTVQGRERGSGMPAIAEHIFDSGVPSPGIESVRMNLYLYGHSKAPFTNGAEVAIERFEYLP
jgi:hypothetical protein